MDFHCDMRGLLIDRGTSCFVNRHIPHVYRLDSGSYLALAVMNGMVPSIHWIYDDFGGRTYDFLHCLKFKSDFSSRP